MEDINSYNELRAMPNKMLNPDGSITTMDGIVISGPSEMNAEAYRLAKAQVNKYINPDGEIVDYAEIAPKPELFIIVQELPETGDINKIYLVPNEDDEFDEYIWTGTMWNPMGILHVELSNYYTKNQVDNISIADRQYTDDAIRTNITDVLGGAY